MISSCVCLSAIAACALSLSGCLTSPSSTTQASAGAMADEPKGALAEAAPATAMASAWSILRVGGDMSAEISGSNGDYRFAATQSRIDTELPEGYPAPTPPGAIDIKKYPPARRAEVRGEMNPDIGSNIGFWPLFQHIQSRDIAMTSPVEMDYEQWSDSRTERPRRWTMSFLYRTPDMGETGEDGQVRIVDTQPVIMLSIGMTGLYKLTSVRAGLDQLQAWLESQSEWERVREASPRAMYYNDPSVPNDRKWMEVQIPVRTVAQGQSQLSTP